MGVLVLMFVFTGRRLAGSVISGPHGYTDKQRLIDPHNDPVVEEMKEKASTNNCGCPKNDDDSTQSSKIHIELLLIVVVKNMFRLRQSS